MMMPMGTLQKRAAAYKKITNSVLLGSLENEKFTDVEIVTLSQYARDTAYKDVMEYAQNAAYSYEELQVLVENLLTNTYNEAREFISIEEERIVIGVDMDKVDDRAVDKALLLLVEVEDFSTGSHYVFGDTVKITAKP